MPPRWGAKEHPDRTALRAYSLLWRAAIAADLLRKLPTCPPAAGGFSLPIRQSKKASPHDGGRRLFGLPDRIRTCGLKSRSLALYPAGLRVDIGTSRICCTGLVRWWTRRDSNPRPPRCERGALPTELRARQTFCNVPIIAQSFALCKGLFKKFCGQINAPPAPQPSTFCGFFEKGLDKRSRLCYNGNVPKNTAASPSGKATDSDSVIS